MAFLIIFYFTTIYFINYFVKTAKSHYFYLLLLKLITYFLFYWCESWFIILVLVYLVVFLRMGFIPILILILCIIRLGKYTLFINFIFYWIVVNKLICFNRIVSFFHNHILFAHIYKWFRIYFWFTIFTRCFTISIVLSRIINIIYRIAIKFLFYLNIRCLRPSHYVQILISCFSIFY